MVPYLISGPRDSMRVLERLVRRIPASRYDERLSPDRFTLRGVVAHLADWEPIFLERMQGAVAQDGFVITPLDESARAVELNYAGQSVDASLARFCAAREATLAWAEQLSEVQLHHRAQHPERGTLLVSELLGMLAGHDAYHLLQITEYLEQESVGTW